MNNSINTSKEKCYFWQGINRNGERTCGSQTAINRQALFQQLQAQGIYPTKVHSQLLKFNLKRVNPIKLKHIADITQQLALLLSTGIELSPALSMLISDMQHTQLKQVLSNIQNKIEHGESFSEALRQQHHIFDRVYISLVEAGEATGKLAQLLLQLNHYLQRLLSIRQKLLRAMFYPLVVAAVATLITILLLLFVVPQFQVVFTNMGGALPPLTQAVIGLSQNLRDCGMIISFTVFLLVIAVRYSLKHLIYCQRFWQRMLLTLPCIKQFIHLGNLVRILRIIATALEAGLPLITALQLSQPALNILHYQQSMAQIIHTIENGQSLQQAMIKNSLFHRRYQHMLSIAESAGELPQMLKILAEQSEAQLDHLADQLSKMLEPCIMVVLAFILGGLIIAMYLPVFKLGAIM